MAGTGWRILLFIKLRLDHMERGLDLFVGFGGRKRLGKGTLFGRRYVQPESSRGRVTLTRIEHDAPIIKGLPKIFVPVRNRILF